MMGGMIDWQAIPVITEMLGIDDIESYIYLLIEIRESQRGN